MACGCLPYGEDEDDPMNVYLSIMNSTLSFPNLNTIERELKKLIDQLLSRFPHKRLGVSYEALKSHSFFAGTHWVIYK
jgi:cGMP-dependent protein kinase